MSSVKSRYRPRFEPRKHTNLCTVQRRLRHLTSISARNIDPNLLFSRRSVQSSLLSLYFTIHAEDNEKKILYKSEIIENTLNPNWREFDYKVFKEHPSYLQTSSVVIYVWGARKTNNFIPIIRYVVAFSGLVYSKEQLRSHEQVYESNSLLFGMFGGYYTAPSARTQVESIDDVTLSETISVEVSNIGMSYQKSSLVRLHNSIKAIHETKQQVEKVKKEMEYLISSNEHRKHKCAQREALIFRNKLLRIEWEKLKQRLLVEKQSAFREKEEIFHRKEELNRRRDQLEQLRCENKVNYSMYIGRREMLLKFRTHLSFRRRQLAAELSYIYPIIELPLNEDNKKNHTISGVPLPDSEDFLGKDDTMLSVGLGNVAHLVYMMAKFLELPLRYPIRPMGSRSSVVDLVTDRLTDKQREFTLYLKGKEKYYFHYGVFLLNKNIAQLRYHSGLGTADLRKTLINLKHLLEVKFGVRIVVKRDSNVLNKANLMANRDISLPYTSSPISSQSVKVNFDLPEGMPSDYMDKERTQSELSGLPDVHIKSHQQHKFIVRNSNIRKPNLKKNESLIEIEEPQPVDLIKVPFEDVVARTIGGEFSHNQTVLEYESREESEKEDVQIDRAEDCLNGNVCKDNENLLDDDNNGNCSSNQNFSRQVSDALIIPDSFVQDQEINLSPSETVMV